MRNKWTVLVDNREKAPLIFPDHLVILDPAHPVTDMKMITVQLETKRTTLKTADYLLEEAQDCVMVQVGSGLEAPSSGGGTLIERKRDLNEVAANCLNPARRKAFVAELERMKEGRWFKRILALEGDPFRLQKALKKVFRRPGEGEADECPPDPGIVLDALMRLLDEYGVELLLLPSGSVPQRRAAGWYLAHRLISGAMVAAAQGH